MAIKLSTLSIILGALMAGINLLGVIRPNTFKNALRKIPRSVPIGCALMILSTIWFSLNVKSESLSDFEPLKPYLFILFIVVGVGSCFFVQDFLGARGLSVILLLLGKLMVDTERDALTDWRWVIACWAYLLVVIGIWFTISPWKMRDVFNWATATEQRTRMGSVARMAFGLFVLALGVTVY